MTTVARVLCAAAALYQILVIVACIRHKLRRPARSVFAPPVSILKPVRGSEPGFYAAIRSHALIDYPEFEILFGVRDAADSAVAEIRRLMAEFPRVAMRLVECPTPAPNGKVGVLIDLAREARHAVLVVNDSDITVPPDYLQRVIPPLEDSCTGLVTCLYRVRAEDGPSRFESLAVSTEFAPSTLVAPLFGVSEFGLGSTLAFRRADLDRAGGFASIADYLADDYQLGCKLHALGLKNVLSDLVVETRVGAGSWAAAWRHQLRWAMAIRLSRGAGYAGLPITFATLWALVAALTGLWATAASLLALRLAAAVTAGWFVLHSSDALKYVYLIPFRDLWGVSVWAAGLFGRTVEWRGRRLQLDSRGRIL